MRNVQLYNALVRVFKEVRIANEDEAAVFRAPRLSAVQNRLKNKYKDRKDLMPERVFGGEQYQVCCPYCGDNRYRLYISHAWDRHMKDEDGKMIYAGKRAMCHNEQCLDNLDNFRNLDAKLLQNTNSQDYVPLACSTNVEAFRHRTVQLPPVTPLNDPSVPEDIQAYVTNRGYDLDELTNGWGVGVGDIWFYPKPSLIFPIVQNGVRKCWQARYTGEDFKALGKPKYYWPTGVKKSWLLYNMDMAKLYPGVVLTEGVLDAIKIGPVGTCMFGKIPSAHQEQLLATHWKNSTLVWIPDEDDPQSIKTAEEYTEKWNRKGLFREGAHVVRLPSGDPGDHSRRDLWNLIVDKAPSLSRFADGRTQSESGMVG